MSQENEGPRRSWIGAVVVVLSIFLVGFITGILTVADIARSQVTFVQKERDTCVDQITNYRADTKAEIHRQLQTLSKTYLVLNQDVFIDILNAAQVDLEETYSNLYAGELPLK